MAFFGLFSIAKEDVSRRASPGMGSIAFPATGLVEAPLRLPGCSGCSKRVAHNPCSGIGIQIPHGEHRYQRVPLVQRPDVATLNRLQTALFALGYIAWGYIGNDILFNSSAANNGSQTLGCELLGSSGNVLTLRADNPKALTLGVSRENPDYPLPDPETGATTPFVFLDLTQVLPVGAAVEFDHPSILAGKLSPMITKVNPPVSNDLTGVTFTVEVWADCSNAREPLDAYYPPPGGRYTCTLRWEALDASDFGNFQAPRETAFSRKTLEFTELGTYALTNNAGGACRILWPGMMTEAVVVELVRRVSAGGGSDFMTDGWIEDRLTGLDPSPGSYSTSIDLTDIDTVTYERAIVTYHPEAIATDAFRIQFASGCMHAQKDPSGSYKMVGDHRCAAPGSSGFSTFRGDRCWKPGSCDAFALGDAAGTFGAPEFTPADLGAAALLSSLWHRFNWIIEQGIPGISSHRNFRLRKPHPGGPSIQGLAGGFADVVPSGYFARRQPHFGAVFGKRITWTDEDDNEQQGIVPGAFYAASEYTAGTTPEAGCIAGAVSGWSSKLDALGAAMDPGLALLPHRLTGRASVYEYEHSAAAMHASNELVQIEAIVSGCSLSGDEDTAVTASVRARFS